MNMAAIRTSYSSEWLRKSTHQQCNHNSVFKNTHALLFTEPVDVELAVGLGLVDLADQKKSRCKERIIGGRMSAQRKCADNSC